MLIISHRGNLAGPGTAPHKENHPESVRHALFLGFDVEVDIWLKNGKYYSGHDKPDYEVNSNFFNNYKLWIHAKNIEALHSLRGNPLINLFYHDIDDCVLTSTQKLWVYPHHKNILTNQSIAVMAERVPGWNLEGCLGVCTDFPTEFKKNRNFHQTFQSDEEIVISNEDIQALNR